MTESTPTPASPTPEFELPYEYEGVRYRWRLTREAVDELCHYCHWIPANRGWTRELMERKYVGATFSDFLKVLWASDVRIMHDGYGSQLGGRCHWKVKHFYFTDTKSFAIEWDETVTEDDHRFFPSGTRDEAKNNIGSFVVKLTPEDYETPGRIKEISESLARQLGGTGSAEANDDEADAETRAMDALKRRHARRRRRR